MNASRSPATSFRASTSARLAGILSYYPMPNQAGDAQGLKTTSRPTRAVTILLDELPGRSPAGQNKQRFFVRYSRNNRVENRGSSTGRSKDQTRQLPVPHQRRAQHRSRLDDVEFVAAERAGELDLVALSRARASGRTRAYFDPADCRVSTTAASQYFGSNLYFPRFESGKARLVQRSSAIRSRAARMPTSTRSSPRGRCFAANTAFRSGVDYPGVPRGELAERAFGRAYDLDAAPC